MAKELKSHDELYAISLNWTLLQMCPFKLPTGTQNDSIVEVPNLFVCLFVFFD